MLRKNINLKTLLEDIKKYSIVYDSASIVDTIDNLIERVDVKEFKIAVVGEFSSGKSTFINAIIGQDLLKHATLETTATITYIHNVDKNDKRKNTCIVNFINGTNKVLTDLSKLHEYTTTQSEIDVIYEISSVDIYINFIDNIEEELIIVDTPGLNGLADKHRELTVQEIKQSHACIYLFQKRGISQTDIEFIKYLTNYQNTFIFTCNFIDELKTSEGETVDIKLQEIKENINRYILAENKNIIAYYCAISALKALVGKDYSIPRLYENDWFDLNDIQRNIILKESNFFEFENILIKIINDSNFKNNRYLSDCYSILNLLEYVLLTANKKQSEIEESILQDRAFKDINHIKLQKQNYLQNKDKIISQLYKFIDDIFEENRKLLVSDIYENVEKINSNLGILINTENIYESFENKITAGFYKTEMQKQIDEYQNELDHKKEYCFQLIYKTVLLRIDEYSNIITGMSNNRSEFKISKVIQEELASDNIKNEIKNLQKTLYDNNKYILEFEASKKQMMLELENLNKKIKESKTKKDNLVTEYRKKEDKLGDRPSEQVTYVLEEYFEDRKGISKVFQFIIGKKKGTRKVPKFDDSAGLNWDQQKRDLKISLDNERDALNKEVLSLENKKIDIEKLSISSEKEFETCKRRIETVQREIDAKNDELKMFEDRLENEYLLLRKKQLKKDIYKYLFEGENPILNIFKESVKNDALENAKTIKEYVEKEFEKRFLEKNDILDAIIEGNLIDIQNRYKNKKYEISKIENIYNDLKVEFKDERLYSKV